MKKFYLLIVILFCFSSIKSQTNEPPVAFNDTITTVSQYSITIDVLSNDYDPDGDELLIWSVGFPIHGTVVHDGSLIYYKSDSYVGLDSVSYKIRDSNYNYSEKAWVIINLTPNLDIPIAINDTFSAVQMEPVVFNILQNDSEPNGDEFKLNKFRALTNGQNIEISDDSLSVIFTSEDPLIYPKYEFKYNVIEKNANTEYISDWAKVYVESIENPNIPTAVYEEYLTVGGIPVECYVLENDINPSGGALNLAISVSPYNGNAEVVGNHIVYTPNFSFKGIDYYSYKIYLQEFPYLYSEMRDVVYVSKNESTPVAVDDTVYGNCGEEISIDVLINDFDPDGADLEIKDIQFDNGLSNNVEIVGDHIVYSQGINLNIDSYQFKYRINETSNSYSYSEWATVTIYLEQNPDFPITVNDYAYTIAGVPVEIDVMENDLIEGCSPMVRIENIIEHGKLELSDNNTLIYTPYMSTPPTTAKLKYTLFGDMEDAYYSIGNVEIRIESNNSYDSLDINNINAGIHSDGYLFNKTREHIHALYGDSFAHFEYPKGSGLNTIYAGTLWIGGVTNNDGLHLSARRYNMDGYDFQSGPISNNYTGTEFFNKWNRLWKLNKTDVDFHRKNYWKEGYEPIDAINSWPGNGDIENGQVKQLAPFYDKDKNGIYEPMEGDYPLIRGDQAIFFIFNDDLIHSATNGSPMKVEIHGMAYAFTAPEDELLNNTIFVHYDIYNRSENIYYDTYIASWTDLDIGMTTDDFLGSNVFLSSYYGYNGNVTDIYYGESPPAQSVTFIAGPFMDGDNLDNPDGNCDYSVNGLNFGDGIVDNERLGMGRFTFHTNVQGENGDPFSASEYYNYLKGVWLDNTPVLYGGMGYEPYGAVGPECRFIFPGSSDTCNWGTNGQIPNEGYNQNGKYWTEEEEGHPPGDRRGFGVCGPITFKSGDVQEIELAYVVGQGDGNNKSSVDKLMTLLYDLFNRVKKGEIIVPNETLGVIENKPTVGSIQIYPNPGSNNIYIRIDNESSKKVNYSIYNLMGTKIKDEKITTNSNNEIDISSLEKGVYLIYVKAGDKIYQNKFVKM